jgi:beta-glucosidase
VETGRLSQKLVRERVKPLFYTRMRLGEFDPPGMNPYLQYNMSLVQSEAHRLLALKAAMQSFVLLKNENRLLPIRKHFNKMAVSLIIHLLYIRKKQFLYNVCTIMLSKIFFS